MQTDQVIWLVVGVIAVLALFFVIRLLWPAKDDREAFSPTAADRQPSTPIRFTGEVPYGVDRRPMPTGEDVEVLLPRQVGSFVRGRIRKENIHDPIYAEYRCGESTVFVELCICGTPSGSQRGILNAKEETDAQFPDVPQQCVVGVDPSYLRRVNTKLGAFFAWTRGGYYFSGYAKRGEADLDAFMRAFPY